METEFIGICLELFRKKVRQHPVHWLTFELGTSQTEANICDVLVTEVVTCFATIFI